MLTVFRTAPRFFAIVLLGAAGLVLAGCDGGPTWNEEDPAVGSTGDVVVPKTTNVLDEEMVEQTLQSEASGRFGKLPDELVFSGDAPMGDVEVGDVVVTGVSEKTPVGFLRKVTGRREEGGQVILETRRAALTEAIDRGTVDTSITISENTIDTKRLYDGLEAKGAVGPDASAFTKGGPMQKALGGFCGGTKDSLCLQYSAEFGKGIGQAAAAIAFKPAIDFNVDIKPWGLESIRFAFEPGSRLSVGAILEASIEGEPFYEKPILGERRLSTFTIPVGPVPVVVSPYAGLKFEVNGEVTVEGVKLFTEFEKRLQVGAEYDGSKWSPIADFDISASPKIDYPDNVLDAAKIAVEPRLDLGVTLRLYETAGPGVSPVPFILGEITPGDPDKPLWTIYGGVEGQLEVDVAPLGIDLAEYEEPIAEIRRKLLDGDEPEGDIPSLLFPPDQVESQAGDEQVIITWGASDAAEEYHVFRAQDGEDVSAEEFFDASVVEGGAINPLAVNPLLLPSITRVNDEPLQDTTYTDAELENGTKYYYRVTAVDEEGNGTEGSEMVTGTPLPDPPDRP